MSIGGSRRGILYGVVAGQMGSYGREAVDDTTVMVVFFDKKGKGKKEGMSKKGWWPFGKAQ